MGRFLRHRRSRFIAGRAAAQLHGLDGFRQDAVELIVPRHLRNVRTPHVVRGTTFPLGRADTVTIEGLRCLTAERLIVESPLFAFSRCEVENAIDSALRMRLVSEQRLRKHVDELRGHHVRGIRRLVDALIDTGGESRLERWFLTIVREGGLPKPQLQRVRRDGQRTIARVDAWFPCGVVVEVAGHATHSSRQQRQHDEQRRTELTLRGLTVLTFTFEDVRDRSDWVLSVLRAALHFVDVTNCPAITDMW